MQMLPLCKRCACIAQANPAAKAKAAKGRVHGTKLTEMLHGEAGQLDTCQHNVLERMFLGGMSTVAMATSDAACSAERAQVPAATAAAGAAQQAWPLEMRKCKRRDCIAQANPKAKAKAAKGKVRGTKLMEMLRGQAGQLDAVC